MDIEWEIVELEAKMAKLTFEETKVGECDKQSGQLLNDRKAEPRGFVDRLRTPSRFEHLIYAVAIILSSLLGGVIFFYGSHASHSYDEDVWESSVAFSSIAANKSLCRRIQLDGGILRVPSQLHLELCNVNHSWLVPANIYDTITLYKNLSAPILIHKWEWADWAKLLHTLIRNLPPESCIARNGNKDGDTKCPISVHPTSEIRLCLDRYNNMRSLEVNNVVLNIIESNIFLMAIEAWVPDLSILDTSTPAVSLFAFNSTATSTLPHYFLIFSVLSVCFTL